MVRELQDLNQDPNIHCSLHAISRQKFHGFGTCLSFFGEELNHVPRPHPDLESDFHQNFDLHKTHTYTVSARSTRQLSKFGFYASITFILHFSVFTFDTG